MVFSRKCRFLVFLCLAVLLISESAKIEGQKKPILIGPCATFPHCNQTCIESHYVGGKCIPVAPTYTESIKFLSAKGMI
ncbi:unnamed protein product, partial [Thlaspi arvense]